MIRPPPRFMPERGKVRIPWDFKKSVFATYQPDTEALLQRCFEFDFDSSKIPKIIKDTEELANVKIFL